MTTESIADAHFEKVALVQAQQMKPKDMPLVAWFAGLSMQSHRSNTQYSGNRHELAQDATNEAEALIEELRARGHLR